MNKELNMDSVALDAWIEAIPENPYDPCPCGCGKKLKYIMPEAEQHENAFIEKWKKEYVK